MTIQELIVLVENKLSFLNLQKNTAINQGDISAINELDVKILNTEQTLSTLKTLL